MNTRTHKRTLISLALLATTAISGAALADKTRSIEVTITNITQNQTFTPIMAAAHKRQVGLFELGSPASGELIAVAESGNVAPLSAVLASRQTVTDVQNSGGLLAPGQSVTMTLDASGGANRISLAAMMLPTNDSFIALDSVRVPKHGKTRSYMSPGYDAGSETNSELCADIPGPQCGGSALSPADPGEGFVHISRGISGNGDLAPAEYDWRNNVAKISVRYVGKNGEDSGE